jgi:DNA-binding XRE family transcriptional regulator
MKTISLEELKDKHLGLPGSQKRDTYEHELKVEILAEQIKILRKERNLTQEQLGDLIGVQRAQISKWENNTNNVTIGTILKVFEDLNAKLNFSIEKMEPISKRQRRAGKN